MMKQHFTTATVTTRGPGLYDITHNAEQFVAGAGIADGLLTALVRHTSASLMIQENADPDVLADLKDFFAGLVRRGGFRHDAEGPDDMPSHIRSALTATSLSIPVRNGAMMLGTWQGIYVFEHRDAPHRRDVALHLIGE